MDLRSSRWVTVSDGHVRVVRDGLLYDCSTQSRDWPPNVKKYVVIFGLGKVLSCAIVAVYTSGEG